MSFTETLHVPHPAQMQHLAALQCPIEIHQPENGTYKGVLCFYYQIGDNTHFLLRSGDVAHEIVWTPETKVSYKMPKPTKETAAQAWLVYTVATVTQRPDHAFWLPTAHELLNKKHTAEIVSPTLFPDLFLLLCSRLTRAAAIYGLVHRTVALWAEFDLLGQVEPCFESCFEYRHAVLEMFHDNRIPLGWDAARLKEIVDSFTREALADAVQRKLITPFAAQRIARMCKHAETLTPVEQLFETDAATIAAHNLAEVSDIMADSAAAVEVKVEN